MKKFLAIILAIIMVFALAVPAFATAPEVPANGIKAITVDGAISSAEWGDPVFSANSAATCQAQGGDAWYFEWDYHNTETVSIYTSADLNNVYVGVKVSGIEKGLGCTSTADASIYPHVALAIGQYSGDTNIFSSFNYEGEVYLNFYYTNLAYVNETATILENVRAGMTPAAPTSYSVAYNDTEKAYNYEMAIPMSYIDTVNGYNGVDSLAMYFDIVSSKYNEGPNPGTRFMIGKKQLQDVDGHISVDVYNTKKFADSNPLVVDLEKPQGTVTILDAYTTGDNKVHVEFSKPVYMNNADWISACVSPWNGDHVLNGKLNNAMPDSYAQPCAKWTFTLAADAGYDNFADFFEVVEAADETPQILFEYAGTNYPGCCGAFYADTEKMDYLADCTSNRQGLANIRMLDMPEVWIGDKASEFSGNIKMDGNVTDEEYGKALISLSPDYAMGAATDPVTYWQYNGMATRFDQNAKIYLTNDDKYIYVAATLDKSNKETGIVTEDGALYNLANFGFSVARWDDKTTVPVIPFEDHDWEQYTAFRFGIKNGKPVLINMTQGIDIWEVPASDYAYKFDEAAGKYSYEIRVPLNKTNIDLYSGLDIAFSATLAQDKLGTVPGNAYQIDTGYASCGGPDNMGHDGHALKVTLNDAAKKVETWVLDTAPKLEGEIKIDGKIEENWGKAVVSTAPNHCQENWGNFWQFDPSSVNRGQNAKLYVTNDENYLYVGATIDECDFDETCTELGKLYAAAHFGFSVSGYDKDNTVKHIPFEGDEYEQYTGFMMGFVNGKKASWTNTQGHAAWELPDEDYAINYDPETRTYTYECRIPFSKMNVTSTEIAISASIGTSYTGGDAANRYNITTGFASAGGAYNFAHKDNALHLNLAIVPNTGDNFNLFAVVAICAVALTACTALVILKRKVK